MSLYCVLLSRELYFSRGKLGPLSLRVAAHLKRHHNHTTGVTTSALLWPATVLRTHERQCPSDSRSAMQMTLDPQPHTDHPGPFPSPQRSAWLKYPWRCIFYIELCMVVHILDNFRLFIQVNSSRHFGIKELRAVHHSVRSPHQLLSKL